MIVTREMTFHASHSHHGMLVEPLHSHEFRVLIAIEAEPNEEGFVCDFRAVKRLFRRVVSKEVEGRNLDELFPYPTSEVLAAWIYQRLEPFLPIARVEVAEKPHSRAIYEPAKERS